MPDYQPIDYRLRCHTKRTDLPVDVLRDIGEAYEEIQRLRSELDLARREICSEATRFNLSSEAAMRRANERSRCDPAPAQCFKDPHSIHYAEVRGWSCFNTPEAKVVKTLNGVIVDNGNAVPPKYEDLGDE